MQLISLDQVFKILRPGVPLPFGVRDARGNLLLAKGLVVPDQQRLYSLLNRGMFVDQEDAKSALAGRGEEIDAAPISYIPQFSVRWETQQRKLGQVLRAPGEPKFLQEIQESVEQVAAFSEGDGDRVLFSILRHDYTQYELYAESHALHVAALCGMVSRRLSWPEERRKSVIGAALTMNLGMINLQAKLAGQSGPLTPKQRKDINSHPLLSAEMLRNVGLKDLEWLTAVEQHHEVPGGTGYPNKVAAPGDASQLVRLCDIFIAKHSPRIGRTQLPSHQAARDLYSQSTGNPLAAALIKECGIFPPGS